MDATRLGELLRQNNNHEEGTFLHMLDEGHFDVGLFNQVLGELMDLKKAGAAIPQSIVSQFGLFAFECERMLKAHHNNLDTFHIVNLDRIDHHKASESLHWCLLALAYDKPIDWRVLIAAERDKPE